MTATEMQDVLAGRARWAVVCADALEVLKLLPDGCCDSIVTDPPSGTHFMGLAFDHNRGGRDEWIAWLAGIMAEARRCIKPGGYALVWALPRTSHWTGLALEEAGFHLRDQISHLFGSGFPKSQSCLKPAHEVWWLAKAPGPLQPLRIDACRVATGESLNGGAYAAHGTPRDDGWGMQRAGAGEYQQPAGRWPPNTLLSHHPSCVPAGVRRVRGITGTKNGSWRHGGQYGGGFAGAPAEELGTPIGYADADGYEQVQAWTCVDGCPIKALDEQAGPRPSGGYPPQGGQRSHVATYGVPNERGEQRFTSSTGSASRYFPTFSGAPGPEDAVPFRYEPKASRRDREGGLEDAPTVLRSNGNKWTDQDYRVGRGERTPGRESGPRRNTHPTCKPTALMAWLCKLATKEGGVVLDCFGGSGSTGVAAVREGMRAIIIEQDAHYCDISRARIAHAEQQVSGPLFAGVAPSPSPGAAR